MNREEQDILLSQLADGELRSDQANPLLLEALDDPQLRERLKEMLRLRQAAAAWRVQQPRRPVMVVATEPRAARRPWFGRRLISYAAAACIGGVLVMAGFWAAGAGRPGPVSPAAMDRVTPEQMQQVARVFALHESVAGPLAWYAADDQNIRVASAEGRQADNRPVAVLLKVEPETGGPGAARTYVIVCRERLSAAIELPDDLPGAAGLRVYLAPRAVNGRIDMRYAIAVAGGEDGDVAATLSGERQVGLAETPLGQLALGDRLLNVEAAAWPIKEPAR